jgi:outer membrane autotransporter protein
MSASMTQAAIVSPGGSQTLDNTSAQDFWQLGDNATLTGTGAFTFGLTSSAGGVINLTNSTATSSGEGGLTRGIVLTNASATLNNSTVISTNDIGISAVRNVAVPSGSTVTLNNGSIVRGLLGGIAGNRFSELNLNNSTVQGTGANSFGVRLLEGTLNASGATIIGGRDGLTIGTDSLPTALVPSTITLDSTRVEGSTGSAIVVGLNNSLVPTSANLVVRNGSTLIAGNGTLVAINNRATANLVVDNSALTGNVVATSGSTANVTLQNNASLVGNLQNVNTATLNNQARMTGNVVGVSSLIIDNASTLVGDLESVARVSINNQSNMTGNVTAAPGSVSTLTLDNRSVLTGQVNNVASFSINNQALWQMTDSQSVNSLVLNGGRVGFGTNAQYFQLNVANLSGSGTFEMGTDFYTGTSDLLNVTGSAAGSHQLLVASTGADPVVDTPIKVVQTQGGSAQFGLANGPVDVGAFTYGLVKEGEDWYLTPNKDEVSTPTRSVLAIFGTAPTVSYAEMVLLNNRMGDLRVNGGQTGGWARTFGSKYTISNNAYGDGYTQNQYGLSIGVDTPVQIAGEKVLLGVFAGYSKSTLDLKRGSSGDIDSTSLGVYGTWLGDSGYYLDVLAKLNHFRNEADVTVSDGTKTQGNYNNFGASTSVEFGKHIEFQNGYYIEPFTQWQAAAAQGKEFSLDNGLKADADTTRSLLGKAGVTLGRGMTLANGSKLQPHVRAAVVQEFVKNNEVRVNDNQFNNDLSGTRFEVATGASWTLNDRWQLHAELDTSKGDNVTKDFGVNMGAHFSF